MTTPPTNGSLFTGHTDSEALRNGVVRQQAVAALRLMLNRMEVAA